MKLRYLCPLCSLPVVAVTTIPFVSSCSSFSSKLYSCASGQTFNSQRSTNDFDKYISDKGKPLNYSAGSSTDTKMCSKIASLLKPSDMIFLMAYDVSNMFNDDDENIAANLSNVVLYVDKQKDNTFNIAEY
jgi:hypothetical protein